MNFVSILGRRLEFEVLPGARPSAPTLVFLHEGLGSVAAWKDFPARCVEQTGCAALVYSRFGYGFSDPEPGPWPPSYLHREALDILPRLLEELRVGRHILIGHSDGGSIALIHAGAEPRAALAGVIVMAPHVMVEDMQIDGIRQLRDTAESGRLIERLGRYHADPVAAFRNWSAAWLHPAFRTWNIEEYLPRIACPLLAMQGHQDQYGTMEQIERIARLAPNARLRKLDQCGHAPHKDQPEAALREIAAFVNELDSPRR